MAVFQKRNIPLYEINSGHEPTAFIAACDHRYESALAAIVGDALETLGQKNVFMLAGPGWQDHHRPQAGRRLWPALGGGAVISLTTYWGGASAPRRWAPRTMRRSTP